MQETEKKVSENFLHNYITKVNSIRNKMTFETFENHKPYSFDYHLKSEFNTLLEELKKELEPNNLTLSPMISNKIPIFLPKETKRIAFFEYESKSVREVKTEDLEDILTKLANKNIEKKDNRKTMVEEDLISFAQYHAKHQFEAYRTDIKTKTIQFNAYDANDTLLLGKSFVRGGLVFDMDPKDFCEQIEISYPRHRKKRSDNKNDYLPLKLIKMRGIHLKKEAQN